MNDPYNDMKYLYLNIQIMTIIIVVKESSFQKSHKLLLK